MPLPEKTPVLIQFLLATEVYPDDDKLRIAFRDGGITIDAWDATALGRAQPTEQELTDAANGTTLVGGQTFAQWEAEHGGDAALTRKRQAKEGVDESSPIGSIQRAILNAFIAEFNRHSNVSYASIVVNNQATAQVINSATPTVVDAFAGGTGTNGEDFGGATSDKAGNRIVLGDAGKYLVGVSASYAHTGGADCDMEWSVYAGGAKVNQLQARRNSTAGNAASLSIGPLILDAATDNVVVDLRVEHNETGARNLIVAHASLFAMRVPSIPARSFADLRTSVRNQIDSE